jgi:hypothetical protein
LTVTRLRDKARENAKFVAIFLDVAGHLQIKNGVFYYSGPKAIGNEVYTTFSNREMKFLFKVYPELEGHNISHQLYGYVVEEFLIYKGVPEVETWMRQNPTRNMY